MENKSEEQFTKARFEKSVEKKYQRKKLINETKRKFVDEYLKSDGVLTDELKKISRDYALLQKGIDLESAKEMDFEVSDRLIHLIFKSIKEDSKDNFVKFYDSYLKKFTESWKEEYVSSAYEDAKTAYYTYRKLKYKEWKFPQDEKALKSEMENSFLVLSGTVEPVEECYDEDIR